MAGGLKRYFVLNGRMIGQQMSPGGSRVDFMTDALGSVTGTVGSNGAVQKTYRFTPYGQFLSETGTGPDPDFRWNGVSQYYNTGLQHADYYVRARNYSSTEGRWTRVALLWSGEPPYAYPLSNPVTVISSGGTGWESGSCSLGLRFPVGWQTVQAPTAASCAYQANPWDVKWTVPPISGFIIQHVYRRRFDVSPTCDTHQPFAPPPTIEYWEAWCVDSGGVHYSVAGSGCWGTDPGYDDRWAGGFNASCRYGDWVAAGRALYFPGLTRKQLECLGFQSGAQGQPNWGVLYHTTTQPNGWTDWPAPLRYMCFGWTCCGCQPPCVDRQGCVLFGSGGVTCPACS